MFVLMLLMMTTFLLVTQPAAITLAVDSTQRPDQGISPFLPDLPPTRIIYSELC